MSEEKHVLRVVAPDAKGLIHAISAVIVKHDLNIVSNDEFVSPAGKFFYRCVVTGAVAIEDQLVQDLRTVLPAESVVELKTHAKKNIVILATKEAHALGDLLIRHFSGDLNANILAVIANHETLGGLVTKFDIPFICIPHEGVSRDEHEKLVMNAIDEFKPDYLVLAKYMRILSANFVDRYPMRIVNIHHSFLPAFIGANPYKQAWERGVKIIGATAHFVTSNLDEGPIIAQDVIRVDHSWSWQAMRNAGRDVEKVVLARALNLVFADSVFVVENRTIIFD